MIALLSTRRPVSRVATALLISPTGLIGYVAELVALPASVTPGARDPQD